MNLHIAKWGNSLAVRIPVEYTRRTGLNRDFPLDLNLCGINRRKFGWNIEGF